MSNAELLEQLDSQTITTKQQAMTTTMTTPTTRSYRRLSRSHKKFKATQREKLCLLENIWECY